MANMIDKLKSELITKPYLDVSAGVEVGQGLSLSQFRSSLNVLMEEGYLFYYVPVSVQGVLMKHTKKVLCAPGTRFLEVYRSREKISDVSTL